MSGLNDYSLDAIGTSARWFQDHMLQAEVRLPPLSRLAIALADLERLRVGALARHPFQFPTQDGLFDFAQSAIGADFLTKAIHWGYTCDLRLPKERLRWLCASDPIVTRPASSENERNKTWETVIACLSATFASGVRFEEPDVMCEFGTRTIAVAAKVIYSPKKVMKKACEGLEQSRDKAHAALAFLDLAAIYPQREMWHWSRFRAFESGEEAVRVIQDSVTRWVDSTMDFGGTVAKLRTFPHEAGVAFFIPSFIQLFGMPVPFLYAHSPIRWSSSSLDFEFTTAFLRACNGVLGFLVP